jgi:hypothetical protein
MLNNIHVVFLDSTLLELLGPAVSSDQWVIDANMGSITLSFCWAERHQMRGETVTATIYCRAMLDAAARNSSILIFWGIHAGLLFYLCRPLWFVLTRHAHALATFFNFFTTWRDQSSC